MLTYDTSPRCKYSWQYGLIVREEWSRRADTSFDVAQNAGHIAEDWRPGSYHTLTDATTYHVLSIDYRGFGHSTGSPDEAGLILDASALIDFAINTGGIPASRIVLVGQSLGTAVVSGAVERYAADGVDFAGVVLVAAFSSLPTMLSQYSIAGWVPVLRPLAVCPPLLRYALTRIVDRWDSASRLADAARLTRQRDGQLRLFLVHAANDWDIPCTEDDKIFAAVVRAGEEYVGDDLELAGMKEERTIWGGADAFVSTWQLSRDVVVRQERFPYGGMHHPSYCNYHPTAELMIDHVIGHNAIISYAPVTAAIAKAFEM